jgi:phosphoglycolate phosphatase-like HAD superfamily hydrolase
MHVLDGKKLIVFDIDGTLIDSTSEHVTAFRQAFKEVAQFEIPNEDDIVKHFGKPHNDVISDILEEREIRVSSKGKQKIKEMHIASITHSSTINSDMVIAGVIPFLEKLKERNFILGVMSGNPRKNGLALLEKAGLQNYFSVTAFSSDTYNGKPIIKRSDILRLAIKEAAKKHGMSIKPHTETLVIGDAPSDILAAKEANIPCMLVATGHYSKEELLPYGATQVVENLLEIE